MRYCTCLSKLSYILLLFTDKNECNENGMCPNGECVNMAGAYKCNCNEGFRQSPNQQICYGETFSSYRPSYGFSVLTVVTDWLISLCCQDIVLFSAALYCFANVLMMFSELYNSLSLFWCAACKSE